MGTTPEWIKVLEMGALFGVCGLLLEAITRRELVLKLPNLVWTAFASFAFGMIWVFEWRVLHGWMAVVFATAVIGVAAFGFAVRRAQKRLENPLKPH